MNQAVEMGLERAGNCGVAAITVKNANHIGRLGSYVEHIAEANMIGLLCANSHGAGAGVAPWGGIAGRLGTNPLAGGWPDGEGGALVLDITTSVVAEGKVRVKRNRGEPVPAGWIIDAAGRPSTDPADFYDEPRGSLLPFGGLMGYKGYGLGVVVELLGGALSGAGCARGRKARIGNGCFLLVIRHWGAFSRSPSTRPKCGRSQTICGPRPRPRASMPSYCPESWKSASDSDAKPAWRSRKKLGGKS